MLRYIFQAEDGVRESVASRGLGNVYKRQGLYIYVVETPSGEKKIDKFAVVR